jgi:hypothetical protein
MKNRMIQDEFFKLKNRLHTKNSLSFETSVEDLDDTIFETNATQIDEDVHLEGAAFKLVPTPSLQSRFSEMNKFIKSNENHLD